MRRHKLVRRGVRTHSPTPPFSHSPTLLAALVLLAAAPLAADIPPPDDTGARQPAGSHQIVGVPTSIAAFVGRARRGPMDQPVSVRSFAEFESNFGGLWSDGPMSYAVADFFRNGGTQALVVRTDSVAAAADARRRRAHTGLYALDKAEGFNLLCLPPDAPGGDTPASVYQAALHYCAQRRAMLLVDPPAAWSAQKDQAASAIEQGLPALGLSGPEGRNAVLYFPRLLVADPLAGGQARVVVPCGAAAGIIARTDAQVGVWKSPAGTAASPQGVLGLEVEPDSSFSALELQGVNCFRKMPGRGILLWGARTLSNDPEYRYVSVCRLALFVQESISRGTEWVAGQQDAEPLWVEIRQHVGAFLYELWNQRGLQGRKPQEAYYVKCGLGDTMTQNDIDQGLVSILVGLAATRPAEFVVVRVQKSTVRKGDTRAKLGQRLHG